jgi:hypothetical protein
MSTQIVPEERFTPTELSSVVSAAISRQGEADRRAQERVDRLGDLTSLDEAIEVARQLGIAPEHVRAAALELRKTQGRELRRRVEKQRRQRSCLTLGMVTLGVGMLGLIAHISFLFFPFAVLVPLTAFHAWRWLGAPISDADADRVEVLPVAGTCRVCGAPAHHERATFCSEHQYRPPSSAE